MRGPSLHAALLALSLVMGASGCAHARPKDPSVVAADPELADDELVGTTPSEWTTERWLNAPGPLSLESLRGRVVLVRWFMSSECPYCSATAPALRALHEEYGARGLVVVGMYHHHGGSGDPEPGEYEGYVRRYGFRFPVAIDVNWSTLERWWLRGHARAFTSASFLLDKQGRIRGVHPGPRFGPDPGDPAYAAIRRGVERLLDE